MQLALVLLVIVAIGSAMLIHIIRYCRHYPNPPSKAPPFWRGPHAGLHWYRNARLRATEDRDGRWDPTLKARWARRHPTYAEQMMVAQTEKIDETPTYPKLND